MKKFLVALSLVTLTSSVFGMNSQRFAREIDSQVNSRVPLRKNTNLITDNDLLEHLVYNAFYGGISPNVSRVSELYGTEYVRTGCRENKVVNILCS